MINFLLAIAVEECAGLPINVRDASPAAQVAESPDVPNMPCRLSSNFPGDRNAVESDAAMNSAPKPILQEPGISQNKENPNIVVRTVYVQPPTLLALLASLLSLLDIYMTHRRRIK
jgi:hypothetical protein